MAPNRTPMPPHTKPGLGPGGPKAATPNGAALQPPGAKPLGELFQVGGT